MPARFDLLVLGDANPDLILSGDVVPRFAQAEQVLDAAVLTVGGSGAITACGAARLGLNVGFCGIVGDDLFGRFMLDELAARDVNVEGLVVHEGTQTGITVALSGPEDRASLTFPGTIASLDAGAVDREMLADARHVHVSQYFMQDALRPGLPALFDLVHTAGGTTSIDPNWDPLENWDSGLLDLLPRADVFLPNAVEAAAIGKAPDARQAARSLAGEGRLVVVKDGPNGSFAVDGSELIEAPAAGWEGAVVDTTGAGDSFDAGFLASHLAGADPARSLRVANACGALSTRALGGVAAQPTMDEVLSVLGSPSV